MGKFKYKLKEIEVGDTTINRGRKSTVTNIDPETGRITWSVESVPEFDSTFKKYAELRDYIKDLAIAKKDDPKFFEFSKAISKGFNEFRSYLRTNYPTEYEKFKSLAEESTTSSNSGFTSGTEGENYATPYAFNSNKKAKGTDRDILTKSPYKFKLAPVQEGPGATMGPGAKAGPTGVKDNAYVKQFNFKLAPKPKSTNSVTIVPSSGKTSPLNEADVNVEEYINSLGVESPELKKHITSRILGFDKLEDKLNELIPLLAQAKNKTMDTYRQKPDFSVVYGTDLAVDYLDDLIEMFKD